MDKAVLSQYLDTQESIKRLEKRIERLEKQTSMTSDYVYAYVGGKKKVRAIRGIDHQRVDNLRVLYVRLEQMEVKAQEQKFEIIGFINSIKSPRTREIFTHRYINGLNWIQIQIIMGYTHEDTARIRCERYLHKSSVKGVKMASKNHVKPSRL